jgi:phage host-nuclease inhibitor protein Gam
MASEFNPQIGKIYYTVPTFYKCADGTLSTHNGRGACNFHGGLSSAKALKLRRRCTPIATRTPTQQGDLFRKEVQADLFRTPTNTQLPTALNFSKKQIEEFKAVKELFDRADKHRANLKSDLADYYEKKGEANVRILSDKLNLEYNTIINLIYDFENTSKQLKVKNTEGVKPAAKTEFSTNTNSTKTPKASDFVVNVSEPSPMVETNSTLFVDVHLRDIKTSKKHFQNRKEDFSKRTVDNIVKDFNDGNFKWSNFDPITLWEDSKGELYILSGHSRFEAFKRTNQKSIPAKIERGISLEEAQQIALNSNTLSTKETDLERAVYYRSLRKQGKSKSEIEQLANRTEGRNAAQVIAFSFLNPSGKALNALMLLDNASAASQGNARTLAKWIGEARQRFPILSDGHENELYNFLLSADGYGRSKGQLSKETDFLAKLQNILLKKGAGGMFSDFDPSKPLNIKNYQYKNQVERDYDEQLMTLKAEIADLEKEIQEKRKDFTRRGATTEQIISITEGLTATLLRKQREYFLLASSKGKMLEASQAQQSLFVAGIRGKSSRGSAARCIF